MNLKPKNSFEELYLKMQNKGIAFSSHSEEHVIELLTNRNYYYRLSSYRKNFKKDSYGKYIGLDFSALVDLASIDTYLREYLLHLCLDIEHSTKTKLMAHITNNVHEDGYHIVEQFKTKNNEAFDKIINQFERNFYKRDMFEKRSIYSVWVFLEVIDFGTMIQFIKLYTQTHPQFNSVINYSQLLFVKNIRNACAHNDVFLINLFHDSSKMKYRNQSVVSYAHTMGIDNKYLLYNKINDIITVCYLHKRLCSTQLSSRRYVEGLKLIQRYEKNLTLYLHSSDYHQFRKIISKCVDYSNQ